MLGTEGSRCSKLLPPLVLLSGAVFLTCAHAGRYLGFFTGTVQATLMVIGLVFVFAPAAVALSRSLGRPVTRSLAISGIACLVMHLVLNIGDGVPFLNRYWLFSDANVIHIVAQEVFSAAAFALVAGALYYYIVLFQTSEKALLLERDRLNTEVNERKNAQERLRETMERFRSLVETTSDWVWEVDENTVYTYASPQIRQLLGYRPEEVLGKTPFDFMPQEESQRAAGVFRQFSSSRQPFSSLENTSLHKEGRTVTIETSGVPIFGPDGLFRGYRGIDRDVTKRKQAEEALRLQSQAMGQTLDGIAIADLNGIIQFVNPAWARMHGYPPDELMGKPLSCFHTAEQVEHEVTPFLRVLREKGYHSGEVGHVRKDGAVFQTQMSASVVTDNDGKAVSIIGIARDITKERKLEAQLRHAQKMDAIGTFAGGIAHNLRNNFASVLGWIEIAAGNLGDADTARKCLDRATAAGHRGSDQIRRILTFSRIEEGRRAPLRIVDAVEEGLRLLKEMLPPTIVLRQEIGQTRASVMADPDQIHQVLINLGTNAFDAMKESGGTLVVNLEEVEIGPEQAEAYLDLSPGQYVQLRVSDSGHGMTPETLDQIFDPFFTTKGPTSGTGLGLSVVHGIVESLNGVIEVSSMVGKGTSFTMLLPVCATVENGVPEGKGASGLAALRKGTSVLLVDDDESYLEMMRTGLELLDFAVAAYGSSVEALEAFRAAPNKFDVVVTDEMMPGITGMALAKTISKDYPDIPIIMVSGVTDMTSVQKARDAGIDDLLVKPTGPLAVAEAIGRLVPSTPHNE